MSELYTEILGAEATQAYEDEHTAPHAEELGRLAFFEEFMPLEEIESPYGPIADYMRSRIVERDSAIDAITDALERSCVRMPDDNKPIATFAFLGSTGTGKTKLAEILSEALNQGKRTLIKVDCPHYSQGHEITGLIGSPPSYVGHDQEPLLSKERVEGKKTVILFDEIEKGSPKLFNLILGITGDGNITLNNGVEVSFRDAVIVMTSNLGAKEMSADLSKMSLGFGRKKETADNTKLEQVALRSFKDFFTPEYVNRITKMIVFPPLTKKGLGSILDTHVGELNKQFERAMGARITLSEQTKDHLVGAAQQESHMGARPLIRAFEEGVQSVFGRYMIADALPEGTDLHVFRREEIPEQHRPAGESTFVFFTKHDENLRQYRAPLAIEKAPVAQEEEVNAAWEDEYPLQK